MTPSTQKINQEETKNPEKRSNPQPIVLYCLGLNTQNPELREVDYEPSPKRGSGKINRLRPRKKTNKKQVVLYSVDAKTSTQHLQR